MLTLRFTPSSFDRSRHYDLTDGVNREAPKLHRPGTRCYFLRLSSPTEPITRTDCVAILRFFSAHRWSIAGDRKRTKHDEHHGDALLSSINVFALSLSLSDALPLHAQPFVRTGAPVPKTQLPRHQRTLVGPRTKLKGNFPRTSR